MDGYITVGATIKEVIRMTTSNLNIQIHKDINGQGVPSPLKLDKYNKETIEAIEEGRKIAKDPNAKGYHTVDELRKALNS